MEEQPIVNTGESAQTPATPDLPPRARVLPADGSCMLRGLQAPRGRTTSAPPAATTAPAAQPTQQTEPAAPTTPAAAAAPATPTTPTEPATIVRGSLLHPIHESRRLIEPTYDRVMRYAGMIVTGPLTLLRWLITTVVNFVVNMVLRTGVSFILELPLRLLGLCGVKVDTAIDVMRKSIAAVLGTVSGLVEGALRTPEALLGSAFNFIRDLASFRWLRQPELLLQTFAQPIFGTITASLTPLFYTLRNIDDAIYPPRPLSDHERQALQRDYPAEFLAGVRIHDRGILHAMMWGDAGAQTIGTDIYLRDIEESSGHAISVLRHELVHTSQVADTPGGTPAFIASYYSHMIANMLVVPEGSDTLQGAYFAIPDEVEAYSLGAGVEHVAPR